MTAEPIDKLLMRNTIRGLLFLLAGLVITAVWSLPVTAQEKAQLTMEQVELNQQAFDAAVAGEYQQAERLLRASLNIGEANFTYLNLGRALASQGRCKEATEAYDKVETSPQVDDPSPDAIAGVLKRFRAELPEQCPGDVVITCDPPTMLVRIDDQEERTCPMMAVELSAGQHTILGLLDDEAVTETVTVEGMEEISVELVIEVPEEAPEEIVETPPKKVPPPETGPDWIEITGWSLLGVGAATVIAAVVYGEVVVAGDIDSYKAAGEQGDQERYDALASDIETGQAVGIGLFVTGGVFMAAGASLAIWRLLDDGTDEEASPAGISTWWTGDSGGVVWRTRW